MDSQYNFAPPDYLCIVGNEPVKPENIMRLKNLHDINDNATYYPPWILTHERVDDLRSFYGDVIMITHSEWRKPGLKSFYKEKNNPGLVIGILGETGKHVMDIEFYDEIIYKSSSSDNQEIFPGLITFYDKI